MTNYWTAVLSCADLASTVSCQMVDFSLKSKNLMLLSAGVEMELRAEEESSQHSVRGQYNDINKVGAEFEVGQFCWGT